MEKLLSLKNSDTIKQTLKGLRDSFPDTIKDEEVTKTGFSPSALVWGDGKCFSGETEFITKDGIRRMDQSVGEDLQVWTGGQNGRSKSWQGHGWKSATVEHFGIQEIYELEIERRGVTEIIRTTKNHRWLAVTDKNYQNQSRRFNPEIFETVELSAGDVLWQNQTKPTSAALSPDGIRHGFVFGDGNSPSAETTTAQFFGEKDDAMIKYFKGYSVTEKRPHPLGNNVEYRRAYGLPGHYKKAPERSFGIPYLYGFLAGYFAADGNISERGSVTISSSKMENLLLVREICSILNIGVGSIYTHNRKGINGSYSDIHSISIYRKDLREDFFLLEHHRETFVKMNEVAGRQNPSSWRVVAVRATGEFEDVYCVVEPETECFTLANGIITKNCPRRWHLLFDGAQWQSEDDAISIDRMQAGTDGHERIQKRLEEGPLDVEIEANLRMEYPPLNSYCDAIVRIDDKVIPLEIKTVSDMAFETRKTTQKPAHYHITQLLLYMYMLETDEGVILYENRDTFKKLAIPVYMTEEYKEYVEGVIEWMKVVRGSYDDGKFAKVFKGRRKNSRMCAACPVRQACDNAPVGDIQIPLLEGLDKK